MTLAKMSSLAAAIMAALSRRRVSSGVSVTLSGCSSTRIVATTSASLAMSSTACCQRLSSLGGFSSEKSSPGTLPSRIDGKRRGWRATLSGDQASGTPSVSVMSRTTYCARPRACNCIS